MFFSCCYNQLIMEEIFEKGNKITTNRLNCLEVIYTNTHQVVCKDLLTGELDVFSKTEHKFEKANVKLILELSLKEIIEETEITEKDRQHILLQMSSRLSNWL